VTVWRVYTITEETIDTLAASDDRRQDKMKQTLAAYNLHDMGDIAKV